MKFFTILAFAIALVVGSTNVSQAQLLGMCPPVTNAMANLNPDNFSGRWYRYGGLPFPVLYKCAIEDINISADGPSQVVISFQLPIKTISVRYTVQGDQDNGPTSTIGITRFDRFFPIYQATVLNTDYNNWAIVETCREPLAYFLPKHVWALTREQHPDENVTQAIAEQLQNLNYDVQDLSLIDQDNCFELIEN